MKALAAIGRVIGWVLVALAVVLTLNAVNVARRALAEPGLSRGDERRIEACALAESTYNVALLAPAAALAFVVAAWARRRSTRDTPGT